MTTTPFSREPEASAAPVPQEVLEVGLSAHLGRPVRITALDGRPLEAQSTYPIERLRVTLDSGEELPAVFKRLGAGPAGKGGRREVLIYRRLLAGARFGAPALYASSYDERGGPWLFLEDVGDETLEQGDRDAWLAAVRGLARMHAAYHGREDHLRSLGCLAEHGADYYHMLARDARRNLRLAGPGRALARFDRLMARFDELVVFLTARPRTLLHGDVFPHNLLLQPGPRVRPVDWEEAAVGLAAWDLARLLDGWGSDKPAFVAAYLEEFARHAPALDARAFRLMFARCAVLNVLWHLGWEAEACRDGTYVDALLNWLEAAWRRPDKEAARA